MAERARRVKNMCNEMNNNHGIMGREKSFFDWLFYNKKLQVVGCVIPKCGSTLLKTVLSPNHSKNPQYSANNKPNLASLSPIERKNKLEKYTKIMFVRHPFHRLWSAYTSKIFMSRPDTFLRIRRDILKIANGRNKRRSRCGNDVTFREFVQYLIRYTGRANVHWRSYKKLCHPCVLDYDFIGHLETYDQEIEHLLTMTDITQEQMNKWTRVNSSIDGLVIAACRLNTGIDCMSTQEKVEKNFQYLAIEGLIDPVKDRDVVMPELEKWLEGNPRGPCINYTKSSLSNSPYQDPLELINRRKSEVRTRAFKSLSSKELDALKRLYKADFQLYGYNPDNF